MSKKKPEQSKIDKAFTQSDKHTLSDLKLQSWTPARMLHAQSLGLLWPNLGKEGWAQFRRTNLYPGAPKDMMIFLYLSTLKPDDVDLATYAEAKAFGIKRGIHNTDSKEFWQVYNKFFEIQREIEVSATKPKGLPIAGTDEDEEADGPPE